MKDSLPIIVGVLVFLFMMWRRGGITTKAPLKPGRCECDHSRCTHIGGTGRCILRWPPSEEWPNGSMCACQVFILDKDDDDGDGEPETPTPSELERLYLK